MITIYPAVKVKDLDLLIDLAGGYHYQVHYDKLRALREEMDEQLSEFDETSESIRLWVKTAAQ